VGTGAEVWESGTKYLGVFSGAGYVWEQGAWLQPGGCALMGCQCPILGGQGWALAQPGHTRNRTKRENRN